MVSPEFTRRESGVRLVPQQRKMVNLEVVETSGVDHPAHLHEGWVVLKGATSDLDGVLSRFVKTKTQESTVPEITEADVTAAVEKAVSEAVAPLNEQIATLTAERDTLKAAGAPTTTEDDVLKSLPESVRKMLDEREADLKKAREEIAVEKAARLDSAAVAKSRETFKALAVEHEVVAPALRRLGEIDADLAKAVETALTAAEEQVAKGALFSEVGGRGSEPVDGAMAKAREVAKSLVAAGTVPTIQAGVAKAFSDDPALYAEYTAEKAGN